MCNIFCEIQFPLLSCVWSSHFGLLQTPGTVSPLLPSSVTTLPGLEPLHAQRPSRGSLQGVLSPYCWPSYTLYPTESLGLSLVVPRKPSKGEPPHKEYQIPPFSTFRAAIISLLLFHPWNTNLCNNKCSILFYLMLFHLIDHCYILFCLTPQKVQFIYYVAIHLVVVQALSCVQVFVT